MNLKLITLACALGVLTATAQQPPVYPDSEAANHIGEEASVTGKVFGVSTSKTGTTYVNLGGNFPQHTFAGVIFVSKQADVGDVKQYEGKEVSLTGRITLSRDASKKPQILISKPEQIKLTISADSAPAPTPPATTANSSTPDAATPMPAAAAAPKTEKPISATVNVRLATGWNTPQRSGEMTRKDLARLFGTLGSASESTAADAALEVYPGIPFLTQLNTVKKLLKLEGLQCSQSKVVTAGLPFDSFRSHDFSGIFPGGYDHLCLITDHDDQVVSVLLVDSSSRTRVTNEPDSTGYHTYNFVSGTSKGAAYYAIRHQVTPPSTPTASIVVDTLLVDPTDPETPTQSRPKKKSPSKSSTYSQPKTGKVLERSRWFVPPPLVNLILRCVGG
ncbi:hypothetical protein [Prosthecobacter sp.]|uniref:hypothetical protein n=1 Tax=Prosthecobacter sp. TaxID=1965333 RepID=UPI001DCCF916|nr:hypothetical protein [Prosthecobacter sp.]MCB1276714.1 hypothetical protein [Prosthecobacter sp.]